jgi:broad specificity phosphatase PhoE
LKIFLVRHGQSQSNADWAVNRHVADHAIELTEEGKRQAGECGEFLARYFRDIAEPGIGIDGKYLNRVRLWVSPYRRTRQTADGIQATAIMDDVNIYNGKSRSGYPDYDHRLSDRKEHLLLAEQQFGIFDGLSDAEREKSYPAEQAHYEKHKKSDGKIWPKMPLGESRFDVCIRVHQAFGTFKRDQERHGIDTIVVVAHGTVNRAFVMMWLHLPYEWMDKEPNPKNCSVRLLEDGEDKGCIFEGFADHEKYKHAAPTKEAEE